MTNKFISAKKEQEILNEIHKEYILEQDKKQIEHIKKLEQEVNFLKIEKIEKILENFANVSFTEKLYNTAHVCGNN